MINQENDAAYFKSKNRDKITLSEDKLLDFVRGLVPSMPDEKPAVKAALEKALEARDLEGVFVAMRPNHDLFKTNKGQDFWDAVDSIGFHFDAIGTRWPYMTMARRDWYLDQSILGVDPTFGREKGDPIVFGPAASDTFLKNVFESVLAKGADFDDTLQVVNKLHFRISEQESEDAPARQSMPDLSQAMIALAANSPDVFKSTFSKVGLTEPIDTLKGLQDLEKFMDHMSRRDRACVVEKTYDNGYESGIQVRFPNFRDVLQVQSNDLFMALKNEFPNLTHEQGVQPVQSVNQASEI